jgi:hypothetical protein
MAMPRGQVNMFCICVHVLMCVNLLVFSYRVKHECINTIFGSFSFVNKFCLAVGSNASSFPSNLQSDDILLV